MTPNSLVRFLTRVHYVEEDRLIVAEFENGAEKTTQKFKFFPFLLTDASQSDVELLVASSERRLIWFEDVGSATKIVSPSFSLLEKLKRSLEDSLDSRVLLLSPVRQFLILNKWSFFDQFSFESNEPRRLQEFSLPFTSFGFLSNNLHVELRELLSEDEGAAKTICSAIFYSNLLRVSLEQLPKTDFDRRELFLENLFFEASRLPERHKSVVIRPFVERKLPLHVFENTAEFDFSKTVSQLSTKQFYNLGFETLDCPCCAPPNAAASNLLPHSLVRVRMLSDGFFFESAFPSFSQSFHLFHPNKQSREQRRQEFGYVFPPIGPFSEGEIVEVPMADAHKLEAAGDAVWVGLSSPHWFCRLRESFLSHAFSDLNRRKLVAEEKIRLQESKALSSHNLRGFHLLGSSPAHFFDKDVAGLLAEFPPLLVLHLMDSNSGFFSLSLGETLESVRLVALDKFFEFNSKRGHKVVSPLSGSSVFVQGSSGFGLAKEFSKAHNIPSPLVRGWHFWSV
ncbi:MAG: hypothetical protein J4215_01440 [Candidatus Diapherotrites archaeon]|uniref:Uncharacterized protein n=1 Tax=Candidatus Iainarchaeum sp. TaxID=3101447 RepID=A0A8T4L1L2_9ARCH|nr:hypothetical protein [Candidatus Diapherotrites archaeon]